MHTQKCVSMSVCQTEQPEQSRAEGRQEDADGIVHSRFVAHRMVPSLEAVMVRLPTIDTLLTKPW